MNLKLLFFLLTCELTISTKVFSEISDSRKHSLDSIVSSMDRSIRKDLDLAHQYLNNHAESTEEKIWLFYGYLGTFFKYDKERMSDFKAPFYSPELTTKKSSGVCRDFSRVFEYLCLKSDIPCFSITGKTRMPISLFIGWKLRGYSTKSTHQWNIVRVDGKWMLMDPTWTHISSKTKVRVFDQKTKTTKSLTIISVDRTYYNPAPEFMAKSHVPIHPAFILFSTVHTFKTMRKDPEKQRIYQRNYDYTLILDSIWNQKGKLFSRAFVDESFHYSQVPTLNSMFRYELDITLIKPGSNHQTTPAFYDERITRIQQLTAHIQHVFGVNYSAKSQETIAILEKRKKQLEKQAKTKKR